MLHHVWRFIAAVGHEIGAIESGIGDARIHEAFERHLGDIGAENLGREIAECAVHLTALARRSRRRGNWIAGKSGAIAGKGLADHERERPLARRDCHGQPELARALARADRDRYLFQPPLPTQQVRLHPSRLAPADRHALWPGPVQHVFKALHQICAIGWFAHDRGDIENGLRGRLVRSFKARIVEPEHGAAAHDQRGHEDQHQKRQADKKPDNGAEHVKHVRLQQE